MATIKLCTDLEQSKKLAEILPIESADMYYYSYMSIGKPFYMSYPDVIEDGQKLAKNDIPCWSLAALLGVLPEPELIQSSDMRWMLRIWDKKRFPYSVGGNVDPIDACYEMIIKLHEQKIS